MSRILFSVTEEEVLKYMKDYKEDPLKKTLLLHILRDSAFMHKVVKELTKELVKKIEQYMCINTSTALTALTNTDHTYYQVFVKAVDYDLTGQYTFISNKLYSSTSSAYNSVSHIDKALIELKPIKF